MTGPEKGEAEAIRESTREMLRLAERLETAPAPDLRAGESAPSTTIERAYADTVEAAQVSGAPVLSDDRFFRRSCAGSGVPAFGMLAVLRMLRTEGALSAQAYDESVDVLRKHRAFGPP
jgi:hypothetical protein